MQKLFKNANLINIESGEVKLLDILIEDDKIYAFGKFDVADEIVDLKEDYVLPNFVNVFCDSVAAFEKTYGKGVDEQTKTDIANLLKIKNVLAGAVFNDMSQDNDHFFVTEFAGRGEEELSQLSESAALKKGRLFLKVGQDLEELGSVDKTHQKPLSYVLEDFGFLDRRPIIVGGNCFEKDELELLSQYSCDFCITPHEDGKFGRRATNLVQLRDRFCVGIGSGYAFEIDFFGYMRQILMTQRAMFEDETVICEQEVLKMATSNGSKIMYGNSRQLEIGGAANFIVVRKEVSLYDDIFKSIVWEKSKKDIVMTVLNGEIVQKNGEILMKNLPNYDKIFMKIIEQR